MAPHPAPRPQRAWRGKRARIPPATPMWPRRPSGPPGRSPSVQRSARPRSPSQPARQTPAKTSDMISGTFMETSGAREPVRPSVGSCETPTAPFARDTSAIPGTCMGPVRAAVQSRRAKARARRPSGDAGEFGRSAHADPSLGAAESAALQQHVKSLLEIHGRAALQRRWSSTRVSQAISRRAVAALALRACDARSQVDRTPCKRDRRGGRGAE